MSFLTDINILFLGRYPISHLFIDLISYLALVKPLRNEMLLLLGPFESLLQPIDLINLGLQKRNITNNSMQSLIIQRLIMICNLIRKHPPIIIIKPVDQIVIFFLILQVRVRCHFYI